MVFLYVFICIFTKGLIECATCFNFVIISNNIVTHFTSIYCKKCIQIRKKHTNLKSLGKNEDNIMFVLTVKKILIYMQ